MFYTVASDEMSSIIFHFIWLTLSRPRTIYNMIFRKISVAYKYPLVFMSLKKKVCSCYQNWNKDKVIKKKFSLGFDTANKGIYVILESSIGLIYITKRSYSLTHWTFPKDMLRFLKSSYESLDNVSDVCLRCSAH